MSARMDRPRVGPWFNTFTHRFWPRDPRSQDFRIEDIAHSLSLICRFGGHCITHYSVGQHCLVVSDILKGWGQSIEVQYEGLMHDSPEAYTGDNVQPRKSSMRALKQEEERIWKRLAPRFTLPIKLHPLVKEADNVALMTERRDLCPPSPWPWDEYFEQYAPLPEVIIPMPMELVEKLFLQRFHQLGGVA